MLRRLHFWHNVRSVVYEGFFDINEELKKLPAKPGVYIMHDATDDIIYVGKAVSLKNRVRQYFQTSRKVTPKIAKMISQIDHFEYIITDSELEALILECNLIKQYRPKAITVEINSLGQPNYDLLRAELNKAGIRTSITKFVTTNESKRKIIESLAEAGENSKIREILRELNYELEKNTLESYSDNLVLNALISEKVTYAKKNNVQIDVFLEPNIQFGALREIDMISMIGNLLDNAIRGAQECENFRTVQIRIFM